MFKNNTQPTELEMYDNALHTLIADRDKMVDRASRGLGISHEEINRQDTLIECCQLAYKYILEKLAK